MKVGPEDLFSGEIDWIVRGGPVQIVIGIGILLLAISGANGQALIQQIGGETNDGTGEAVTVEFAPSTFPPEEVGSAETFAERIWPGGAPPFDVLSPDQNGVAVHQRGSGNESTVSQTGSGHSAVLVQTGDANTADVEQIGSNHTALVRQMTSNHTLDLTQMGLPASPSSGSDNLYMLDFVGPSGGVAHTVEQHGSHLQLYQQGSPAIPFRVEQQGNGMRMIIRHGN